MQVKEGFVLRKVGVQYIVAPTGELSKEFNGMIRLNETGAFIFEKLMQQSTEEALVQAVAQEYEIDAEDAKSDVDAFIELLHKENLLKGGE